MKESEIISKLAKIVEPICTENGAFLVEITVLAGNKKVIEVVVQTDEGITSQQIISISREINKQTETVEFFETPYQVEVGSPGIGKPIKMLRAFNSQMGRLLVIEFKKELNRQPLKGNLKSLDGQILSIEEKKKKDTIIHIVNFDDIKTVMVDVEW